LLQLCSTAKLFYDRQAKLEQTNKIIMMKNLIIILLTLASTTAFSQKQRKNYQEINFKVSGVCGMCEDRIESALDVKGIRVAEWNKNSLNCRVIFNTAKITETEVHQLVADVGHDTEKIKATDEAYNGLHSCCKYKEDITH